MDDFESAKSSRHRFIQCIEDFLPRLLPGLPGMGHIHLENPPSDLARDIAVALRTLPHSELLQRKTTFRTLAHGGIEN